MSDDEINLSSMKFTEKEWNGRDTKTKYIRLEQANHKGSIRESYEPEVDSNENLDIEDDAKYRVQRPRWSNVGGRGENVERRSPEDEGFIECSRDSACSPMCEQSGIRSISQSKSPAERRKNEIGRGAVLSRICDVLGEVSKQTGDDFDAFGEPELMEIYSKAQLYITWNEKKD
ncbi:unnamed protein product [Heligmosomoides polygyrus]|uniref:Uncharacterized protein n=1 Tax=Heligmosomoides polygyrus TaxID=6339 RepID=A0A183F6M4_HELPZ|nr:unnamed protein product [Heligmosomoides polygyrus]